jgi:general secretion pathway protein G
LHRRHAPFTSSDEDRRGGQQRRESAFHSRKGPCAEDMPPEQLRGYSLVELLIVVAIISIIAGIAIPSYREMVNNAQIVSAIADIKQISNEITLFRMTNKRYPASLQEVGMDGKLDPWNRPYVYLLMASEKGKKGFRKDKNLHPLNSDYDLYSCGRDGRSVPPLTAKQSRDDIVRANNGGFVGLAINY